MDRSTGRRIFACIVAIAIIAAALAPAAWADGPTTQPATGPAPQVSLERAMKQMGRDFKTLHKQVSDAAENQSSAGLAADMIRMASAARTQTPPHIAKLSGDQRDQALAAFKAEIGKLIAQLQQLQDQLAKNDNAGAGQSVHALEGIMKEGHSQFNPKAH